MAACLAVLLAGLVATGCGDEDEAKKFSVGSKPSPKPFVRQFAHLTGVRLKPVRGDLFGTRLEVPPGQTRFHRFGAYSLIWIKDEKRRKLYLGGGDPDDDGIYWRRVGSSFSANKPFGKRLVLRWVGRRKKETTPQWDRLERAVGAASRGSLSPLQAEERPCSDAKLDPLRGETGACSLNGIPVTFVNADDSLSVPALEARVLGLGTADELRSPGSAPVRPKQGQFLLVGYRIENKSSDPISYLHPELRLGGRTRPESPEGSVILPRSRALPLPPGAAVEAQAAFDVAPGEDFREGALVLPAEREGKDDPTPALAQGWIRLQDAPSRLPRPRRRGAKTD